MVNSSKDQRNMSSYIGIVITKSSNKHFGSQARQCNKGLLMKFCGQMSKELYRKVSVLTPGKFKHWSWCPEVLDNGKINQ